MFKILTSLALTAGLITQPSIASDLAQYPTELVCSNENKIMTVLKENGEEPLIRSLALRQVGGVIVNNVSILFVNAQTRTWTVVEKFTDDMFCVVSLGTDAVPYTKR